MIGSLIIIVCVLVFVCLLILRAEARIAIFAKQLGEVSEKVYGLPPIPQARDIANFVLQEMNTNFCCPTCHGLIPPGTKFCRHCGTDLKLVKRARLLGCKYDAYTERYSVDWQCTQCGDGKQSYWHKSEFGKYGPFIHLMRCGKCGHVGDALINPQGWSPTKPWLIAVSDPGSLKLEKPEDVIHEDSVQRQGD